MQNEKIQMAADLLQGAEKTVALTGAGVSTESGIPDFRSKGGLWSRFDPQQYGTLGAFRREPAKVWRMLAELVNIVNAKPNRGHDAMARLEEMGLLKCVITQNIDGLHQQAGSLNVIEFHGSLATFSCLSCGHNEPFATVIQGEIPPHCPQCQHLLKPDIIFFDEQIPHAVLTGTEEVLVGVDLLLVIGTTCQVIPASFIPNHVQSRGGKIIEINLEPALADKADISIKGKFSEVMTALYDCLPSK